MSTSSMALFSLAALACAASCSSRPAPSQPRSPAPPERADAQQTADSQQNGVRVLLDPETIRFDPPADARWGDPPRSVHFFDSYDRLLPGGDGDGGAFMKPIREAGCSCEASGVETGVLRVRLAESDLVVDAMCGQIWHPVHQTAFLYRKADVLDDSNPAAVDAALAQVRTVVESGWTGRAGCDG